MIKGDILMSRAALYDSLYEELYSMHGYHTKYVYPGARLFFCMGEPGTGLWLSLTKITCKYSETFRNELFI